MGKVTIAGGRIGMVEPVGGIPISGLAVGSSVYLNENGAPVEYLVVNHGIPSNSSLYDSSCNGTWILRKDIYEAGRKGFGSSNSYADDTDLQNYLNVDFLGLFDEKIKAAINQVKIPYYTKDASSIVSGTNGHSAKIFLLSSHELYTGSGGDGACLDYFSDLTGASTKENKRIAYLAGTATDWWLRSVTYGTQRTQYYVKSTGDLSNQYASRTAGIRPALVLSNAARVDENTMIVKGV